MHRHWYQAIAVVVLFYESRAEARTYIWIRGVVACANP
jgi:hypothetical protein